jgi:BMFP domain-containing protein YqiC
MSEIETAIESMIESYIDDQDFVSRTDASMEAEAYTDQCVSDCEDSISELIVRIEALEEKLSPAMVNIEELQSSIDSLERIVALVTGVSPTSQALEEKAAPAAEEQEPRAVNQIDWIMTTHGLIAGYDSKAMLESYVRSVLPADQSHQAEMLIAMVLTTARNLINKKLEAES